MLLMIFVFSTFFMWFLMTFGTDAKIDEAPLNKSETLVDFPERYWPND